MKLHFKDKDFYRILTVFSNLVMMYSIRFSANCTSFYRNDRISPVKIHRTIHVTTPWHNDIYIFFFFISAIAWFHCPFVESVQCMIGASKGYLQLRTINKFSKLMKQLTAFHISTFYNILLSVISEKLLMGFSVFFFFYRKIECKYCWQLLECLYFYVKMYFTRE